VKVSSLTSRRLEVVDPDGQDGNPVTGDHHVIASTSLRYPTAPNRDAKRSNRQVFLSLAAAFLLSCVLCAQSGLLGGDYAVTPLHTLQDAGSAVLTGILGYLFVKVNTIAVDQSILEPRDSRKIIHTLSAPLFAVFWPMFSPNPGARFFAACVPITNAVRLYLAATAPTTTDGAATAASSSSASSSAETISSSDEDASLARAVSRSGDRMEALGGPFVYVIVMTTCVLLWWRSSPVGVVALATLAAGDGIADLVGRRFGTNNKWPGSNKSVAGTLGFVVAAAVTSLGLLLWLNFWGSLALPCSGWELVERVATISVVSAFLELVPVGDDNYTVPLAAALLSALLLSS
jgi:CDP-diglyceride synthetase